MVALAKGQHSGERRETAHIVIVRHVLWGDITEKGEALLVVPARYALRTSRSLSLSLATGGVLYVLFLVCVCVCSVLQAHQEDLPRRAMGGEGGGGV